MLCYTTEGVRWDKCGNRSPEKSHFIANTWKNVLALKSVENIDVGVGPWRSCKLGRGGFGHSLCCVNTTLHIIINKFQLTGKSHLFCTIIFRVLFTQTSVVRWDFVARARHFWWEGIEHIFVKSCYLNMQDITMFTRKNFCIQTQ